MMLRDGATVTDAAAKLGVGRPALSNMLNGNAALSWEMALKIEHAYGIDGDELMRMQWEFDRWCARHGE
jgi:addiction module HigA family antidote